MLTGDRAETAEAIGAALDLDAVLSDRDPADKVAAVAVEQAFQPTLMVGDGVNDAPALAAAHVGVAMGVRGASASSEAADVVILVDRLRSRFRGGRNRPPDAYAIAFQSMAGGMALSGVAMVAAAFGWLPPIEGALTQEAIDVAVILNALRALRLGPRLAAAEHCGERRRSAARGPSEASRRASTGCAILSRRSTGHFPPQGATRRAIPSAKTHEQKDGRQVYPRTDSDDARRT